jgi:hypothetical protein
MIEESAEATVDMSAGFTCEERRVYGDTQVVFAAFTSANM